MKNQENITQNPRENPKLTVYYDGLCKVCDREMSFYKSSQGAEQICFVDICSSGFDAQKEGVDPFEVHKVMHAKTAEGQLRLKVDAFIAIWEVLPKFQILAKVAKNKPFRSLLDLGYKGFVKVRPYLPRKEAQDCTQSPYCEMRPQKQPLPPQVTRSAP